MRRSPVGKVAQPPIFKVEQPMRFQYFFTDDGTSNFLVSRNPTLFSKYGRSEGDLNVLGCVTSFGDNFGTYFIDELEENA
jgi:hypothetical protein